MLHSTLLLLLFFHSIWIGLGQIDKIEINDIYEKIKKKLIT
jgi:hypothetical protein